MIAVALSEQFWWYVARSSGFISWAALTFAVLWGLALSTRLMGRKAPPAWLLDAHRFLGALSVIFVGVHLGALVLDDYVYFGWAELFVPMASEWQPGAVAWGVVGFYLLVAVQLTSLAMSRLPRKLWRWVHFSSFVLWVLATVHVLEAGTDVTNPVFRYSALASVQLVLFFLGVRMLTARRLKRALRDTPGGPMATVESERAARLAALRARSATAPAPDAATTDDRSATRVEEAHDGHPAPIEATDPRSDPVDPELAARLEALRQRRAQKTAAVE